jgi:hypothetical protein
MDTVCGKPVTYGLDREVGFIATARILLLIRVIPTPVHLYSRSSMSSVAATAGCGVYLCALGLKVYLALLDKLFHRHVCHGIC